MKELILSLNKHLRVTDCKITADEITFNVSSTLDYAYCTSCSQTSMSVHDSYLTCIQDLPIQGKTVYLQLITRRFKCHCTTCSKKTFSETFPFKVPNAKKTIRLMNLITDLAESRSASGMTRDLKELGILVKKSSLCNYLGQKKIQVNYQVSEICIDDFALKKHARYGKIMVDILTGTIVDLLESREKGAVVEWLKNFPQIKIISRDGSRTYAAAIHEAHPKAVQVTDRFHLIARLCEIAQTLMHQFFQPRIPVEISDKKYEEFEDFLFYASRLDKILYVKKLHVDGMTKQEIRMKTGFSLQTIAKYVKMKKEELPEEKGILRECHHNQLMEERQKKIEEVRHLFHQGMAISEISDVTGYTYARYLEQDASSISGQYGISRPGKLMNYRKEILELRHAKKTY